MRTFLAIELPDNVASALAQLAGAVPVGKPTPRENLHLTLAFLGEQPEEVLEELHHDLESLAGQGFDLEFEGLGSFGGEVPKVLFAAVQDSKPLKELHKKIRSACHRSGITLPRERYKPHVTLARFNRGLQWRDAERLESFVADHARVDLPSFSVSGFSLFQSVLHPDGAVHDELASYGLNNL